jgi:hypothetical protein
MDRSGWIKSSLPLLPLGALPDGQGAANPRDPAPHRRIIRPLVPPLKRPPENGTASVSLHLG